MHSLVPVAALLLLAALAAPARGQQTKQLGAFTAVSVCAPINVLIQPGNNYSLSLQADSAVEAAITSQSSVSGNTLNVLTGPFTTSNPIQVAVTLPANQLAAINNYGGLSSVYVQPGKCCSPAAGRPQYCQLASAPHLPLQVLCRV